MTASSCSSAAIDASGIRKHEFQDALALLACAHDPIPNMLEQFCSQRAASTQDRRWKRIFGRFDPDKQPHCIMVYEASGGALSMLLVVELCTKRPEGAGESYFHDALRWVHIAAMESDSKLATLPQLMTGTDQVQVMRYRPRTRCTLRVQNQSTGQVRYAKVFPDDTGEDIHRHGIALWQAAARGELGFQVARPDHWDTATRTVWQGCVPGSPIFTELAGDSGADMAWRLGGACSSLPQSTLCPLAHFSAAHQLKATVRNVQAILRYLPGAGNELEKFLDDLTEVHQLYPSQALLPIHGAPHAHQWLAQGYELGLVDFDRFCLGDPELDVATFIAEMDFERSTRVPVAQLNQAFVDGYESSGMVLRRPVLQAYRAQKRLAKALRSARSIRPDGMERARLHLALASEALRGEFVS
jgi:Phosphotransferase enzyme family